MALSSEKAFLTLLVGHTQSKRFLIVTISFQQNAKIPQKQSFSGRLCGSGLKYHICTRSFGKQEKDCHLQRFSWEIRFCIFLIDMASLPVDFCGCEPLPPLSCPVRDRYAGGFCTQYKEKGRKKQGEFSEIVEGLYLCYFAQNILSTFD